MNEQKGAEIKSQGTLLMVSYGGNPMRKKPTFRNSTGHCTMDFKTIQEIPSPK